MAIRNVVTRGFGAGASIAFVTLRGYSVGAASAPVAVTAVGGDPRRIRRRYPRRIYIDGRLFTVRNAEEERTLLRRWLEALHKTLATSERPSEVVAAKRAAIRVARRIAKVDNREDAWMARLRQYDEELILLLH